MDKKTKRIIVIINTVLVVILLLGYFLFIHNKEYVTYTKNYDEYMCWKIQREATLLSEIYDTKIYIEELDDSYYEDFVIYYLYNDKEYSQLYYTGKHDGVENGDYVLAELKEKSSWKKYNIDKMYFAYDPFWGNEVELHIKNKNGEFYIISPEYNGSDYGECIEYFYKKILDNSDLDISKLNGRKSHWY